MQCYWTFYNSKHVVKLTFNAYGEENYVKMIMLNYLVFFIISGFQFSVSLVVSFIACCKDLEAQKSDCYKIQ